MEPEERWKTAAISMASDLKVQTMGRAEKTTETVVDMDFVQSIIKDWNAMSKKSANLTIEQYGPPNEAIPSRLIWYNNGPWKRTIVYRDEIPHDFPQPHTDIIENFIDYRVPSEIVSELSKFDGSLVVERTKGEVSSRCDMEAANFTALNVMNDIVQGKLNAEQARQVLSEVMSAYMMNRPAPYAEALQFEVSKEDTMDTDEVTIGGAMVHQAIEKVEDLVGPDENNRGSIHH
jgi:polyhydroxyalkanoate synthesis regulator phasin